MQRRASNQHTHTFRFDYVARCVQQQRAFGACRLCCGADARVVQHCLHVIVRKPAPEGTSTQHRATQRVSNILKTGSGRPTTMSGTTRLSTDVHTLVTSSTKALSYVQAVDESK